MSTENKSNGSPIGHQNKRNLSPHYGRPNSVDTNKTELPLANYYFKDHRAHSSSCPRNSIDTCKAKIYTSQQGWKYSTDAIEFREDAETEDEPQSEPDNMPTNNTVQREDYTLPRLLPEKLAMHLC